MSCYGDAFFWWWFALQDPTYGGGFRAALAALDKVIFLCVAAASTATRRFLSFMLLISRRTSMRHRNSNNIPRLNVGRRANPTTFCIDCVKAVLNDDEPSWLERAKCLIS